MLFQTMNLLILSSVASFSLRSARASSSFSLGKSLLSLVMSTSTNDKPKLVYFDAKGVVELSRCMLKVGDIDFEDYRFDIKVLYPLVSYPFEYKTSPLNLYYYCL